MSNRPLSEEESEFTAKNIINQQEELDYVSALIKQTELGIEVAPIVAKHQIKDMEARLNKYKSDQEQLNFIIQNAQKQLAEGVPIKNEDKKNKRR